VKTGKYLVLIHHKESAENAKVSVLPAQVLDRRFRNSNGKDPIKILKISRQIWDVVTQVLVDYAQKTYSRRMVVTLAERKHIPLQEAANILQQRVDELGPDLDAAEFFKKLDDFYKQQME